jgi:hypothetical protein
MKSEQASDIVSNWHRILMYRELLNHLGTVLNFILLTGVTGLVWTGRDQVQV